MSSTMHSFITRVDFRTGVRNGYILAPDGSVRDMIYNMDHCSISMLERDLLRAGQFADAEDLRQLIEQIRPHCGPLEGEAALRRAFGVVTEALRCAKRL